jgi:hypothetical protein
MVVMLEFNATMSSFSITRKKTPFQKHREEEEAKKKVCIVCLLSLLSFKLMWFC